LRLFEAEKKCHKKDIGECWSSFGPCRRIRRNPSENVLILGQEIPEWAKDDDGDWMGLSGQFLFITNNECGKRSTNVLWADILKR